MGPPATKKSSVSLLLALPACLGNNGRRRAGRCGMRGEGKKRKGGCRTGDCRRSRCRHCGTVVVWESRREKKKKKRWDDGMRDGQTRPFRPDGPMSSARFLFSSSFFLPWPEDCRLQARMGERSGARTGRRSQVARAPGQAAQHLDQHHTSTNTRGDDAGGMAPIIGGTWRHERFESLRFVRCRCSLVWSACSAVQCSAV